MSRANVDSEDDADRAANDAEYVKIAPYRWQRALILPVVVVLAALWIAGFVGAFVLEAAVARALAAVVGLACGWLGVIALELARFRHHSAVLRPDGVIVTVRGTSVHFSWTRLSGYRDRRVAQILELYDDDATKIFAIDHMTRGFKEFRRRLSSRLGRI